MQEPRTSQFLTTQRFARSAAAALALVLAGACNAYDPGDLDMPGKRGSGKDAGSDSSTPDKDGATSDSSVCVPSATGEEICNGKDDDCDGTVDNHEAAQAYCEKVLLHSLDVRCDNAVCIKASCAPGYASCDGMPDNGCEALFCSCPVNFNSPMCDDGGADDGGADGG
jgi:hypothetical protein